MNAQANFGKLLEDGMQIAFFGSTLVSAYWDGATTYYRGIIRALAARGHRVTFFEPDAFGRPQLRDGPDPEWARIVVYSAEGRVAVTEALARARSAEVIIKCSRVGVFDDYLEAAVLELRNPGHRVLFWDMNASATLDRVHKNPADPFLKLIPEFDLILTYGGGELAVQGYQMLGARDCVPIYNALDPETHYHVAPDPRFQAELAFLGDRLPDRETRVEEFFFAAARLLPAHRFLLGGNGWSGKNLPPNVMHLGHVSAGDHNALNSSCLAILSINRDSMADYGFSPPSRIFEAAGAAACIVTDAWDGIEMFLAPGEEALIARNGAEVAAHLVSLSSPRAKEIGRAAQRRVFREHTYAHRAAQFEELLDGAKAEPAKLAAQRS